MEVKNEGDSFNSCCTFMVGFATPVFAQPLDKIFVGSNGTGSGIAYDMTGAGEISWALGFIDALEMPIFDVTEYWNDIKLRNLLYVDSEITAFDKAPVKEDEGPPGWYIVVGGPSANSITRELVDSGKSKVNWSISNGQFEEVEGAWGAGTATVTIVAGKDRNSTRKACQLFKEWLGDAFVLNNIG